MPLNSSWPLTVERQFGKNCLILKAERTEPKCNKKFRSQLNQYQLSLKDGKLDISFSDEIMDELYFLLTELMYQIMKSYPEKIQPQLYAQANIRLTGKYVIFFPYIIVRYNNDYHLRHLIRMYISINV